MAEICGRVADAIGFDSWLNRDRSKITVQEAELVHDHTSSPNSRNRLGNLGHQNSERGFLELIVNHFEFRMVIPANNGRASWGIQRHQGELLLAWLELYFGMCQGIHLDVLDQWLARDFTSACLLSRPPLQRLHGIVPYSNCPLPHMCDLRKRSLYDLRYAACVWVMPWLIQFTTQLPGPKRWLGSLDNLFYGNTVSFQQDATCSIPSVSNTDNFGRVLHSALAHLYSFVLISNSARWRISWPKIFHKHNTYCICLHHLASLHHNRVLSHTRLIVWHVWWRYRVLKQQGNALESLEFLYDPILIYTDPICLQGAYPRQA